MSDLVNYENLYDVLDTVKGYVDEKSSGGGGGSGAYYNCFVTNMTSESDYNSLVNINVINNTLFEMWSDTRNAYVKINKLTDGYIRVVDQFGDCSMYVTNYGPDVYIPYDGPNNDWYVKVIYGALVLTDTNGLTHLITPTTDASAEDIILASQWDPGSKTWISGGYTSSTADNEESMGTYTCELMYLDMAKVANNCFTHIHIDSLSEEYGESINWQMELSLPSVTSVCNLKRKIFIENSTITNVIFMFVYNRTSVKTVAVTANTANTVIELDFQTIPGLKFFTSDGQQ